MVFPHEHVLLRFNGHFGTNATTVADRWSVNLRFGLPTSAPAYDVGKLQTFVNAAQAAANGFHASTLVYAGTNCFLDYVSGAQIGVLGRYVPAGQLTVNSPTTSTAGGGTPTLPWNSASVISLRTNIPRGRGSNGRMYWPATALSILSTTGRITTTNVGQRLNQAKTFLEDLNTAAAAYSTGMRLIVASNVGGGLYATVTSIRADDRLDSIERRENDQASTWSVAALA